MVETAGTDTAALAARLAAERARFVAFVAARVGRVEDAEEIVQAAFVKSLAVGGEIRDEESAVAWFYRVLRNAIVDHLRSRGADARTLARFASEMPDAAAAAPEPIARAVCGCLHGVLATLPRENEELVRRVDVDGASVADVAADLGLTANAASARLFRARRALRKRVEEACGACATHRCLDCTCGQAKNSGDPPK
jgi:RNA polymerase sigma-70 factor (ECF subfamily)